LGHTLPAILQAILYIGLIEISPRTLVLLLASTVAGAWCDAGIVARLFRRAVQLGVGSALVALVGFLTLCRQHALPLLSRDRHFDLVPGIERLAC
jgi:hypothetical protein